MREVPDLIEYQGQVPEVPGAVGSMHPNSASSSGSPLKYHCRYPPTEVHSWSFCTVTGGAGIGGQGTTTDSDGSDAAT